MCNFATKTFRSKYKLNIKTFNMVNATFYVQIINNFHVVLLLHKPDLVKMSQFFQLFKFNRGDDGKESLTPPLWDHCKEACLM